MSKGHKTTEFWITLAVLICGTLLLLADKIPADTWEKVGAGAVIGYPVARGLAKFGNK